MLPKLLISFGLLMVLSPLLVARELTPEEKNYKEKVQSAGLKFLTAEELQDMMASETPPIVVDVLSPEDYGARHIAGAINLPYNQVKEHAEHKLPKKNDAIVVYCGSFQCGASLAAGKALKEMGYTNIYDFKGGIKQWQEKGLPMEGKDVKK